MKVSDYIVSKLSEAGVKHAFVVQGGAIAHIIDSIAKHPDMDYVCVAHEQAGALACHGYAGVTKDGLACAMATTGPGIINMLNGIATLYYDSFPGIFIGGQVTTLRYRAQELGVRQLGFQESPHSDMARHITKYSATVTQADDIRYEIEKALYFMLDGRPGPVFLDICDDVQRQDVEPESLRGFDAIVKRKNEGALNAAVDTMLRLLAQAKRPVLALGNGVRVGGAAKSAIRMAEYLGVPVLWSWGAMDFLPTTHPLNAGGFGVHSPRYGNFTVQNCDLFIGIGIRLSQHQTGSPISTFARGAKRVMVDVDENELSKLPELGWRVDVPICCDAATFIHAVNQRDVPEQDYQPWIEKIHDWRLRYPIKHSPSSGHAKALDPYHFIDELSRSIPKNAVIFGDVGASLSWMFQAFRVKEGQTILTSFNNHTMGYSLPAAIGAALADPTRPVISINGDGSILMNIQEWATLAKHQLPVKVFILNNHGYGVIKQTQEDYFGKRYNGVDADSGLSDPNFLDIAQGFNIPRINISTSEECDYRLPRVITEKFPIVCNVVIDRDARIAPAVINMRAIEDIAPFLPRDVLKQEMIVELAA